MKMFIELIMYLHEGNLTAKSQLLCISAIGENFFTIQERNAIKCLLLFYIVGMLSFYTKKHCRFSSFIDNF